MTRSPLTMAADDVKARGTSRDRETLAYLQARGRHADILTLAARVAARYPRLTLVA